MNKNSNFILLHLIILLLIQVTEDIYTTERFLQNQIAILPHLILMQNLSPITSIKLLLFSKFLVVFHYSLRHA